MATLCNIMGNPTEDFIRKFHSIEGVTIGERKKCFFNLLTEAVPIRENVEVAEAISANLKPKTFLEEHFRLEVLIFFRRAKKLLEILKEGNDVFISKIIRQKWFILEIFKEVGAEELVNEYLPSMSYTVRMKILRKLSKYLNPEEFDKIFDAVATRYGTFISNQFFLGCSSDKIKKLLKEETIKLNQAQLRILHKKDPKIVEFFFTEVTSIRYLYPKFFKYLYTKDRALYDVLDEKEKPIKLKFGRRLTKRIINVKRNEVLAEPLKFIEVIDMKAVIRKLGPHSLTLFRNSLPKNLSSHNVTMLWYFARKYHYNLVFKTIPEHYSIRYVDSPKLIDEDLLNLEPDNQKRAELAKVLVNQGQDDYIKYLLVDEAISMMKEKINVTSDIDTRRSWIMDLVRTCKINNEPEHLIEVIKYFLFRHKNDDVSVFRRCIHSVNSYFPKKYFSEEMWNRYFELLTLFTLKHEDDLKKIKKIQGNPLLKFILCDDKQDQFAYLYFLYKRGVSVEELLPEMFSDYIRYPSWGQYDKHFEKIILTYIINNAAKKPLDDDQLNKNKKLIKHIDKWDSIYTDDQIGFQNVPFLMETYKHTLEDEHSVDFYFRTEARNKIFTKEQNEERKEYLDLYWRRFSLYKENSDFQWFLKHDPQSLRDNLEVFLGVSTENNDTFRRNRRRQWSGCKSTRIPHGVFRNWYMLKKFSHLGFDEKTINYCRSKLDDEEFSGYRSQYVSCLSVIMSPEQFVVLAVSYKPTEKKLDLNKEEDVKMFNVQCAIAEKFKYTRTYTALPSLLNYCMGDYFQHARCSLYSLMYRTPEKQLSKQLKYLAGKAVSVRKHALYFACELATVKEVEEMMKVLSETEGVVSLQKYFFSACIKYFLKNPQERFFDMVKNNMLFITKDDGESHDLILEKYSAMPKEYRGRYVQHAWEHFEKVIDISIELLKLKVRFLCRMKGDEALVPLDFGLRIIKEHLYPNVESLMLEQVPQFAFNFFLHRKENDTILKTILDLVETSSHKMSFFDQWYEFIMARKEDDLSFFKPVQHCYEKFVDELADYPFESRIKVYFLKTRLEMARNRIENFTEKVLMFMDDVSSKYGHRVVDLFLQVMRSNLHYFLSDTNAFCLHLLKLRPSADIVAFVLDAARQDGDARSTYNTILREIQKIPDEGIQIYLYWKCRHYLSSYKFSMVRSIR